MTKNWNKQRKKKTKSTRRAAVSSKASTKTWLSSSSFFELCQFYHSVNLLSNLESFRKLIFASRKVYLPNQKPVTNLMRFEAKLSPKAKKRSLKTTCAWKKSLSVRGDTMWANLCRLSPNKRKTTHLNNLRNKPTWKDCSHSTTPISFEILTPARTIPTIYKINPDIVNRRLCWSFWDLASRQPSSNINQTASETKTTNRYWVCKVCKAKDCRLASKVTTKLTMQSWDISGLSRFLTRSKPRATGFSLR